jgi:hypothetical protein
MFSLNPHTGEFLYLASHHRNQSVPEFPPEARAIEYQVVDGKPRLTNIIHTPVLSFDVEKTNRSVGNEGPDQRDILRISALLMVQNATTNEISILESLDVPFPYDPEFVSPECYDEFWNRSLKMFNKHVKDGERKWAHISDKRAAWILAAREVTDWFNDVLLRYRGLDVCRLTDNPYDVTVINRLLSLFPKRYIPLVMDAPDRAAGQLPEMEPRDRDWSIDYDRTPDGAFSYSNNALVDSSYYTGIRGCEDNVWGSGSVLLQRYRLSVPKNLACQRKGIPIPSKIEHDHHPLNDACYEGVVFMLIRHARYIEINEEQARGMLQNHVIKELKQNLLKATQIIETLSYPRA